MRGYRHVAIGALSLLLLVACGGSSGTNTTV